MATSASSSSVNPRVPISTEFGDTASTNRRDAASTLLVFGFRGFGLDGVGHFGLGNVLFQLNGVCDGLNPRGVRSELRARRFHDGRRGEPRARMVRRSAT